MPLMSSKMTFFYKRISPIIWVGLLALFFLIGLPKRDVPFLVVLVLMVIISYQFMKKQVFNLVDEVFDVGDALLVRSGGWEERIALADQSLEQFHVIGVITSLHLDLEVRLRVREQH